MSHSPLPTSALSRLAKDYTTANQKKNLYDIQTEIYNKISACFKISSLNASGRTNLGAGTAKTKSDLLACILQNYRHPLIFVQEWRWSPKTTNRLNKTWGLSYRTLLKQESGKNNCSNGFLYSYSDLELTSIDVSSWKPGGSFSKGTLEQLADRIVVAEVQKCNNEATKFIAVCVHAPYKISDTNYKKFWNALWAYVEYLEKTYQLGVCVGGDFNKDLSADESLLTNKILPVPCRDGSYLNEEHLYDYFLFSIPSSKLLKLQNVACYPTIPKSDSTPSDHNSDAFHNTDNSIRKKLSKIPFDHYFALDHPVIIADLKVA